MNNSDIKREAHAFAKEWPQTSEGSYRITAGGGVTYSQALADFAHRLVSQAYEEAAQRCDALAKEYADLKSVGYANAMIEEGIKIQAESLAREIRALKDSLSQTSTAS